MPIGPTYATFGNTQFSRGFDFTFAPGVQPSVCMVYTLPHTTNLPQVADLTIKTDSDQTLAFRDCLLEEPKLNVGRGGQHWTLPIKDRRWRWQFATIDGWFNKPEADGTYTRERTPKELSEILLREIGGFGDLPAVNQLPDTTRPERRWDGANAAAELDALCSELNCIVTLNPITDRVEIWQNGNTTSTLPAGGAIDRAYTPVRLATPRNVETDTGPALFQATFTTEAVGLETTGRYKRINALSYTPPGGWKPGMALAYFENIPDSATFNLHGRTQKIRDLAQASVYRCFRVTGVNGWERGVVPPRLANWEDFKPEDIRDLQLMDVLAEEDIDPVDNGLRSLPAIVHARWERFDKPTPAVVQRYPHQFSFSSSSGATFSHNILTFSEPMVLFSGGVGSEHGAAQVQYECAFHAGWQGKPWRELHFTEVDQAAKISYAKFRHSDLIPRIIYRFDSDANQIGSEGNEPYIDQRLGFWGDIHAAQYSLKQGGTILYEKLIPISPDGLTRQITWSGGGGRPATTRVSQAQQHNRLFPTFDEYRERLTLKRIGQKLVDSAGAFPPDHWQI
jgi:hypothetical protein